MRKILFTLALLAFMVIGCCPQANAQEPYNPDYKANFFPTGWSIGIAGDITKTADFANWNTGDGVTPGAQIRATKRVGCVTPRLRITKGRIRFLFLFLLSSVRWKIRKLICCVCLKNSTIRS